MGKKAPTLKDVAQRAGVSRMAVSAVINNMQSTVRVAPATRERIFEAMAELRYQPNVTARSLRRQQTDTIGFYNGHGYIDMRDPFAPSVFQGLQSAASSFSNHLLLYNGFHLKEQDAVRHKLLSSKADGVVIWPAPGDEALVASLAGTDKPLIQFAEAYPGLPAVVTDDYRGAHALAAHLAERGRTNILFRRGVAPLRSEVDRYQAFADAAGEFGLSLTTTMPADRFDHLTDQEKELIRRGSPAGPFSAVACWHDASAMQVMRHCLREGIQVPDDIALAGIDGFAWREFPPERPLTTVVIDWSLLAHQCVELLIERVHGREIPDRTIVPGRLRIGATT
ncbi:putative HTH-type transcriptional regulator [Capsulimonas corticalis]|uniref:HTH-type transcriptional regulator n=1 Tax=Capsulimonas corticalis TaxID=2219043 RepID=A0A402CVK4_9BACT|nr:LacI family DNA-binding transcriptional regulator [Capsulimonas corticalis]BDI30434.1 putative HTH-type transcriptional regulator [Capsulimonas corticalis]